MVVILTPIVLMVVGIPGFRECTNPSKIQWDLTNGPYLEVPLEKGEVT